MSLKSKLLKKSTIEETASLEASKIWSPKDIISTDIPALNVALSGDLNGGMGPGILQIAGKSKMFKSKFALLIGDAFQKKFSDGVVLIYDSEFGTPKSYYNGMTTDNIIHSPVVEIEELSHDIITQFDEVDSKENDKLLVIIDSLGNLASRKEVADAREGNDVVDLTRSKKIKSLFRLIGPRVGVKDIYVIVINHTYDTIEKYSKQVVGGGTGTIYNSNGIWLITSSKETEGEGKDRETVGFDFNIKIEKSRFVKQDSKIPITVNFDSGVYKYSGLLEMALEAKILIRPTLQKWAFASSPTDTFKKDEIDDKVYEKILADKNFQEWVRQTYKYKDE